MSIKSELKKIGSRFRSKPKPQVERQPPPWRVLFAKRFLYQQRLLEQVRTLEGDIVECGLGRGATLLNWGILAYEENAPRHIWGFDSFEGFPEPSQQDASPRNPAKGEWSVGTLREMLRFLKTAGLPPDWIAANVTLVKGFFEESLVKYTGEKIALLHIDADLYQSYKTTLNQLYDKVVPGGVIALDEYMGTMEHYNYPGARQAVDEFFADKDVSILRDQSFGKYYLMKPPHARAA